MNLVLELTQEDLNIKISVKIEDVSIHHFSSKVPEQIFSSASIVKYTDKKGVCKFLKNKYESHLVGKIFKKDETYFESLTDAIEHACAIAEQRGFEVEGLQDIYPILQVEQTHKLSLELFKKETKQNKMLHIAIYRVNKKTYELTHYIN